MVFPLKKLENNEICRRQEKRRRRKKQPTNRTVRLNRANVRVLLSSEEKRKQTSNTHEFKMILIKLNVICFVF